MQWKLRKLTNPGTKTGKRKGAGYTSPLSLTAKAYTLRVTESFLLEEHKPLVFFMAALQPILIMYLSFP